MRAVVGFVVFVTLLSLGALVIGATSERGKTPRPGGEVKWSPEYVDVTTKNP